MEREDVVARARELGSRLRELIAAAVRDVCPGLVHEVRGVGLLLAIEWEEEYLAYDFMMEMLDRRVIIAHSMNASQVTRFTPPAVLDDGDVRWLEDAVRASAEALATRAI
jgi:putrescine aminotransferase